MFRSFLLRLSLILSTTASICLFLMAATLGIQEQEDGMIFCGTLFGIIFLWLIVNWIVVRKVDPELSVEVARVVLPAGAVLSIVLSILMAILLSEMIPGSEGKQHYILPFVGVGVAIYLIVRCFDIKWLRGEEEIVMLEERDQ